MFRGLLLAGLLTGLAGCGGGSLPSYEPIAAAAPGAGAGRVYLLVSGWHTDLAVPVGEISGPLAALRDRYPGARDMVFGYGKRSYMTEPGHDLGDWFMGPFPGAGALEVSAIASDPAAAYPTAHIITLDLPPGGAERLSGFLWQTLKKGAADEPVVAGHGDFAGSVVYDAIPGYDLNHTCNTWSAQALAAAGLPIRPAGIIFSRQIEYAAAELAARRAAAGHVAQAGQKPP